MQVMKMYEWEKEQVVSKLIPFFKGYDNQHILTLLQRNGMLPISQWEKEKIRPIFSKEVLLCIKKTYKELQKEWEGPNVPLFLAPLDVMKKKMVRTQRGKSGLAFNDKVFLFLSESLPLKEIQAVLVHEYHHVCRLQKINKKEENYTLIDSIIMEGLAESAVQEYVGEDYVSSWTSYYTEKQAHHLFKKVIKPSLHIKRRERAHDQLLVGGGFMPRMIGYHVGFQIVQTLLSNQSYKMKDLFFLDGQSILEKSKWAEENFS
ncbi:DUF2268 domain-containing protein [Priestia endophytica]|uniref:DUF2268 domain-containing protein n=1 Tax=Priestia endophytica TaxID=135735 RepID=UPI000F549729|nr:DUF2268 domain-containing protein [Priestia endophytica]RPK12499.1 hypothetical protein FH5_02704 [Priestia endophytica]